LKGRSAYELFKKHPNLRLRYPKGHFWSRGSFDRTIGVDIETSHDANGHKYSIGWIGNNEWVKYTITVTRAGIYDVVFRVASNAGGGALELLLDGQPITSEVAIPNTNGWYNWTSVPVTNVSIAGGEHELTLHFIREGFNLNQMHFVFKSATGVGERRLGTTIDGYELRQNYPNPFLHRGSRSAENPETRIDYTLPVDSHVTLTIYNVVGQEVQTLVKRNQKSGHHLVKWDGRDRFGNEVDAGIYVYILQAGRERLSRKLVVLRPD